MSSMSSNIRKRYVVQTVCTCRSCHINGEFINDYEYNFHSRVCKLHVIYVLKP